VEVAVRLDRTKGLAGQIYRQLRDAVLDGRLRPDEALPSSRELAELLKVVCNAYHAVKTVFGAHARELAFASTKSMTGHLLGAAGGLESAVTALAVRDGMIPPTINYETPDPSCDLDCVPNVARRVAIRAALNNSFGFGGTNASLLLTRHQS